MPAQVPIETANVRYPNVADPGPIDQLAFNPFDVLGRTGIKRYGWGRAFLQDEWLPQLAGQKAALVYREMADSDPVIGAALRIFDLLTRRVVWRVEPAGDTPAEIETAEFIEGALEDMDRPFQDLVSEILSMLVYGWSWFEIVYKHRQGDAPDKPRKHSKHDDGKVGWATWSPRAQWAMNGWVYDKDNDLVGMRHLAPPDWREVIIPTAKSLHFRLAAKYDSPEGASLLRTSYRSWWFLKKMQELEGLGIERDLAGLPVAFVDPQILSANASPAQVAMRNTILSIVQNVRRDAQEGVIFPRQYDRDGNLLYDFQLMSSGGSRQIGIQQTIERYENRIAISLLCDFVLLGSTSGGSWALSSDKTNLLAEALESVLAHIADVINQQGVTRLLRLNNMDLALAPKVVAGEVNSPSITDIATYLSTLGSSGMTVFPNRELEDHLYELGKLPVPSDEVRAEQDELQLRDDLMGAGMIDPLGNPYPEPEPGPDPLAMEAARAGLKPKVAEQVAEEAKREAGADQPRRPKRPEIGPTRESKGRPERNEP